MVLQSDCKKTGNAYKRQKDLVLAFQRCLTYKNMSRIKYAELEKSTKMNMMRSSYIYIASDCWFSLNDSL